MVGQLQEISLWQRWPPPDSVNIFNAQFVMQNDMTQTKYCLTMANVKENFAESTHVKAPGPDNIPDRVLRECAKQLPDVLTDILNISLSSAAVPMCHHPNHPMDDVIPTTLHLALTHLDNKYSYGRKLFIDFRSAFNSVIPQHLKRKLNLLGLNTFLCNWILLK